MKAGLITKACIGLVVSYVLATSVSQAQSLKTKEDYIGFSASFGARTSNLTSSYAALNGMTLNLSGAAAGLVWGKHSFETRFTAGYHFSGGNTQQTIDSYSAATDVRLFPLGMLLQRNVRIQPYVNAGVMASNQKFYGFYADEDGQFRNYSVSLAPYVGNIVNYSARFGAGLQWSLRNDSNFVKLFAEVNYSTPIAQSTSEALKNTAFSKQVTCDLGISVGLNRVKSILK